jgi:hypothetical protein
MDNYITVAIKDLKESVEASDVEGYIQRFYPKSKPRVDKPIVVDKYGNKSTIATFNVGLQDTNIRVVEQLGRGELKTGKTRIDVSKPRVSQSFEGMTVVAQSHDNPQFEYSPINLESYCLLIPSNVASTLSMASVVVRTKHSGLK